MARKFDGRPLLQVPHYGRTNVSPIGSCASTTQPQKKKNSYVLTFCCSVIESEAAKKKRKQKKTIHSLFFN